MESLAIIVLSLTTGLFVFLWARTFVNLVRLKNTPTTTGDKPFLKTPKKKSTVVATTLETHKLESVERWRPGSWTVGCWCGWEKHSARTEADAIEFWKQHAKLYITLIAEDETGSELERVQKEFDEFVAKCYCKDIIEPIKPIGQ